MASKKVIAVNESSLVDLKAELYRKETQAKREKIHDAQPKKAPIWQKKKKEPKNKDGKAVNEKSMRETFFDKELEKSRLMLEAKSALYNKLSNGEIEVPSDEDTEDGRFLVDFHQKTLPKSMESKDKKVFDGSLENHPAKSPDEEWVEYVDSFGRSKMCLRKDLSDMKEKDDKLKLKSLQESQQTLLSDDMRRELMRKKWEQEVQDALDKPVGPVHYQDVLFDETRQHGVGYYKFSKIEEERQEQQNALNKLRTQTEQQRKKREKLLEKRKAAMDARLAKIRERKQRRVNETGKTEETQEQEKSTQLQDTKTEETSEEMNVEDREMAIGIMVERIRNKSTKIEKAHLNEWDKGKVDLEAFEKPKRKAPSYDPQSERNPEFAPPSIYANEKKRRKARWKQADSTDVPKDVEISNVEKGSGASSNHVPTMIQRGYPIQTTPYLNGNTSPALSSKDEPAFVGVSSDETSCYAGSRNVSSYANANYQNPSNNYQNLSNNYQNPSNNCQNPSNNYQNPSNNQNQSNNCQNPSNNYQKPSGNYQNTRSTMDDRNVYYGNTNCQNSNISNSHSTSQRTNPDVQRTNYVQNAFPNLPPPPTHTFPPPRLPLPYQFSPQYPPSMPYAPNYPSPSPSTQQYPKFQ